MSRTIKKLRCAAWWGDWARLFYYDNKELRQRGRKKRDRDRQRVDERELRLAP